MSKFQPIGIDLGTTNSAVAYIDEDGITQMIPLPTGEVLTSSVVFFGQGEILVGEEAKRAGRLEPDQFAEAAKRDMGKRHYQRPILGKWIPSEVIQSCILRRLRAQIADSMGDSHKVVITVPAYFDEARRKATADAGQIGGLDVLDIVNEPTAAALAFGEQLGYLDASGTPRDALTLVVYDLGGGTFDVTAVKLTQGEIVTLATDGDAELGGIDWDLRIAEFVLDAYRQKFPLAPKVDKAGTMQVRHLAEEAKHTLTDRLEAEILFDWGGNALEVTLTRVKFEELTADLLERTAFTTRQMLRSAGLLWSDVDRLLMVGGSSRMPMVRTMLAIMSQLAPDANVDPDEAVARGAAIYAQHLLVTNNMQSAACQLAITDVNAHSLGVEGINQETLRKENAVLIPRNSPLPIEVRRTFVTKEDHQESIKVQLLEGESTLPAECRQLAKAAIRNLPPGHPAGTKVDVVFRFDANGRLSVHAKVEEAGEAARIQLDRLRGLDDDRVQRWKHVICDDGGFESFGDRMFELIESDETDDETASLLDEHFVSQPKQQTSEPAVPHGAPQSAADTLRKEYEALPSRRSAMQTTRQSKSAGWGCVINIVGYVVFSAMGLAIGYYLVCLINPEANIFGWEFPGLQPPPSVGRPHGL